MSDWRPYETAPKDGSRVLMWWSLAAEGPHEAILHWDAAAGRGGLWVGDDGDWFILAPTYWMPLPDPPAS